MKQLINPLILGIQYSDKKNNVQSSNNNEVGGGRDCNLINIEWLYFNSNPDSDPDVIYIWDTNPDMQEDYYDDPESYKHYLGHILDYFPENFREKIKFTDIKEDASIAFPVINGHVDMRNVGYLCGQVDEETGYHFTLQYLIDDDITIVGDFLPSVVTLCTKEYPRIWSSHNDWITDIDTIGNYHGSDSIVISFIKTSFNDITFDEF